MAGLLTRIYVTYEELKPVYAEPVEVVATGIYVTYEELKHGKNHGMEMCRW